SAEKIIIIAPAFPYRGGIAATSDRLAQEYVKRGAEVEVWTFKLMYPKIIFPGKSQYLEEGTKAPQGIIIHRKISSINPFNWIKVGRQLKKSGAQKTIIRYWLPFMAPALGTIAKFGKSKTNKVVCLADNVIPHEKRMGDKMLSKYFLKKMDGFIVMAEEGIGQLKDVFNISKPINYSPHPLFDIYGERLSKKEACEKLKLDAAMNYILSFGLVRKYKGVDLLIEAFETIKDQIPNHQLIIAGESYDNWDDYQSIIDKYDLNSRIIRKNLFIPNEEVKYYFSAADFLALTYRTATQSGVTQIAYSMELPMLVTDVGDLSNMVKHDLVGQVCENSIEEIAKSLLAICQESNITKYSHNIKDEKKRFEWSKLCDSLDSL
ncbi:MAG: glycosyltransferase involved in cell wall biosynthesis, partial [Arenicella sp.]